MEVQTKTSVKEIILILTPRDFSSVRAIDNISERIHAIINDMCPKSVMEELEKRASVDEKAEKIAYLERKIAAYNMIITSLHKKVEGLYESLNEVANERDEVAKERDELKEAAEKEAFRRAAEEAGQEEAPDHEEEKDDSVVKAADKSKYYNAVFQHIGWEHAQQLLTMAKQLNIEFGQINPE